ncbi:MAG: hypothetical protein V4510_08990 [bacterium]
MPPPEARLRLGQCDVLVVGTIAGFVPDAARIDAAFAAHRPDRVALGIPPEDLATLGTLASAPQPEALIGAHQAPPSAGRRRMSDPGAGAAGIEALSDPRPRTMPRLDAGDDRPIAGLDAASVRLLELLGRFGPTRIPSPDLESAHRLAAAAAVPLVAIDLDDAAHAEAFTRLVKVRHLIRSNSREKKLLAEEFAAAPDAYALAAAWDAQQTRVKPLAAIERLREQHMAVRLRELAGRSARLLAILPATRMAGVARDIGEGI